MEDMRSPIPIDPQGLVVLKFLSSILISVVQQG
jgi:hypothetical protein